MGSSENILRSIRMFVTDADATTKPYRSLIELLAHFLRS
jgi:hypothetical protein